jgi:antitoxin (DNA-binding transcriptional repressor) of toxin-antitoxin stability system
MQKTINTKELRASLPKIVEGVKRGENFTVLYRSRPAFRIVPINNYDDVSIPLSKDPLYHAGALGESSDGLTSIEHDALLYGKSRHDQIIR